MATADDPRVKKLLSFSLDREDLAALVVTGTDRGDQLEVERDSGLTKEQQERFEAQAEAGRGLLEVLERLLGASNSEVHGDHIALSRGEYGRAVRNLERLAAAFGEESR